MLAKQQPDEEQIALNLARQIGITPDSTNYCLNLKKLLTQHDKFKLSYSRVVQHYLVKESKINSKPSHPEYSQYNKEQKQHQHESTVRKMGLSLFQKRNIRTSQTSNRLDHDKQWRINTARTTKRSKKFENSSCLTQRNYNQKVAQKKTLLVELWHSEATPVNPELMLRIKGNRRMGRSDRQTRGKSSQPRVKYNSTVKSFEFY